MKGNSFHCPFTDIGYVCIQSHGGIGYSSMNGCKTCVSVALCLLGACLSGRSRLLRQTVLFCNIKQVSYFCCNGSVGRAGKVVFLGAAEEVGQAEVIPAFHQKISGFGT